MLSLKKLGSLVLVIVLCLPFTVNGAEQQFDLTSANRFLQQVNQKLEKDKLNISSLKESFLTLENLNSQAGKCIENANQQLVSIAELEKETGMVDEAAQEPPTELQYVQNKKKQQLERLTACRLFTFKSQDTINDLKKAISQSNTNRVFAVNEPLWKAVQGDSKNYTDIFFAGMLIFTTLITVGFLWFLPRLNLVKVSGQSWQRPALLAYRTSILTAAGIIIFLVILGYGHLVVFLSQGVLLTTGCILIYSALIHLGNTVLDQEKIHRGINLGTGKKISFIEFKLFKFALYVLLAGWLILILLEWWGVSLVTLDEIKSLMIQGRTIYGIDIIPLRLLIAIMVFSVIQMIWKYTLLYLSKVRHFDPDADSQVVITSLLSYLILAIAILAGLAVSGVSFTNLAIIAGALSVGIGLGLQNIVNNFVSGIILLLEKPIKPGDRVLIQGTEGIVKKISFRYTRILTFTKENVIIPNSDVMSNPIVNFTFSDNYSKFKCEVGVAYDSDLELVEQTLLNVAAKHPDVLRDPTNKPIVYMKSFAENNLIFDLEGTVSDINVKARVQSEMNILIAKAFKQNGIVIAFPQRDIHIKSGSI